MSEAAKVTTVTVQIARAAGVKEGDCVCEVRGGYSNPIMQIEQTFQVGPGPGGITRAILEAGAGRLDVIEIDQRFVPALQVWIIYSSFISFFCSKL